MDVLTSEPSIPRLYVGLRSRMIEPGAPHLLFEMWDRKLVNQALFARRFAFSENCEATSTTGSWSGKVAIIVRWPPIAATVRAMVDRRGSLRFSRREICIWPI